MDSKEGIRSPSPPVTYLDVIVKLAVHLVQRSSVAAPCKVALGNERYRPHDPGLHIPGPMKQVGKRNGPALQGVTALRTRRPESAHRVQHSVSEAPSGQRNYPPQDEHSQGR